MERLIGSRGRSRTRPAAARGSRNDRTPSRVMGEEGGGRSRASPTTSVLDLRSTHLIDSWALLTLLELDDCLSSKLAIAAPHHVREALYRLALPPKSS